MLDIWNKVKKPPQGALKPIQAGRLKGKSDISPIWRYQAMTETFGPCGVGWKYEITRTWTEDAPQDQRFVFVQLNLYFFYEGAWSEAIPGFGGDIVLKKESAGLHLNDEAYKMATTDALGDAMKRIGVAADVYWEAGSKYTREQQAQELPRKNPPANSKPVELANEEQRKKLFAVSKESGAKPEDVKALIAEKFELDSTSKLTKPQCSQLIDYYEKQKQAQGATA